eukprot:3629402-Prymnesium_polylepis.1
MAPKSSSLKLGLRNSPHRPSSSAYGLGPHHSGLPHWKNREVDPSAGRVQPIGFSPQPEGFSL